MVTQKYCPGLGLTKRATEVAGHRCVCPLREFLSQATRPISRSVCQSVCPTHYCPCPTHYCPFPTARDRGSRVYGLVFSPLPPTNADADHENFFLIFVLFINGVGVGVGIGSPSSNLWRKKNLERKICLGWHRRRHRYDAEKKKIEKKVKKMKKLSWSASA